MAEIKLRINQELKDDLKQIAKREGRSLNKQVEIFLDFATSCYLYSEAQEDEELTKIADSRADQKRISVKLEDL